MIIRNRRFTSTEARFQLFLIVLSLCGLAFTVVPLRASADETSVEHWRISIKVLLNESQTYEELSDSSDSAGTWPGSGTSQDLPRNSSDWVAKIVRGVNEGNKALDYSLPNVVRLDLIEVIELAGLGDWNVALSEEMSGDPPACAATIFNLEAAAKANPGAYAWREDAINVYLLNCGRGFSGQAQYPGNGEIVLLTPNHRESTLIHEVGHHMGLRHTFGSLIPTPETCQPIHPSWLWRLYRDDDGIADTLSDNPCWEDVEGLEALTFAHYGISYADATPRLQERILNTFENTMSYRNPSDRLTTGQVNAMRWESSTSRVSSTEHRFRRTARAFTEEGLNARLKGHWVPAGRPNGWVSWLTVRDHLYEPNELSANIESDYASMTSFRFTSAPDTDAATAAAPVLTVGSAPRPKGQSLTYTLRPNVDETIELRVVGYNHDQGYPAFFQESIELRRASVREVLAHFRTLKPI